jgi:hypothetical protein
VSVWAKIDILAALLWSSRAQAGASTSLHD